MEKNLLSLSLQRVSPNKGCSGGYSALSLKLEDLWQDLQVLLSQRKFAAAKQCANALLDGAQREGKKALMFRASIVCARLSVLQNEKTASQVYQQTLQLIFGEEFIYVTPYSFSIDAFWTVAAQPSEYFFLFEEYLHNAAPKKKKAPEEHLFYTLLGAHAHKTDPWCIFDGTIDLGFLPDHFRETYLAHTTTALKNPFYLAPPQTIPPLSLATIKSKHHMNAHYIYHYYKSRT
ncbi:hypothetical protein NEDG_00934 [Nematocida displodere]|uniref:Uncharacterized protein n=1 Tax=Nematocida displodere TaxID=1805483 RepID=A0A177EA53_9MICR|nr:hypothetical protein NEDG_00934 [Nematocida displodere]